jgi:Fic family protein
MMFEPLDQAKTRLDAHRPFSPEQQVEIDRVVIPRRIYTSNAFEDNSLTLEETAYYIETQRMIGGKLEREYHEVKGMLEAVTFLREAAQSGRDLDEEFIHDLHRVLTEPIEQPDRFNPGEYRSLDSIILGQDGIRLNFVTPSRIPEEMAALIAWYRERSAALHPLERAVRFHYRFSLIHPFTDGNGRVARLLDDFLLENAGYGPLIVEDREEYFAAHRQPDSQLPRENRTVASETADLSEFMLVLQKCSLRSMELMLDVLEKRESPIALDLQSRLEAFDQTLSGDAAKEVDQHLIEAKEATKLALGRDISELLKGHLQSRFVQFIFSGPAKFSRNNHNYSPLISEVSKRHQFSFAPSEALYEYHLVPNLQGIEASGMPLQPFMKLLSIAVLSFADNVGIFSAVLPFEFGRVYIKQENREEISLKLEEDSITEMIGPAAYPEWDRRKLQEFLLQTLDNYFQRIEEDYQAWEDNKS